MKPIKVAAAVLNQTPLDWDGNRARIVAALRKAREDAVSVVCLPELCITGYGCEDAFHGPELLDRAMDELLGLLPETRGLVASVGLPLMHLNGIFNVAAMLVNGRLEGFVAKRFLAGDGVHYEPRWFKAWPRGVVARHGDWPIGDLHFDVGGVRIGFEICEDAWVAMRPGGTLAKKGVDVILNPSASHFAFGKRDVRQGFVVEGSRAFTVTYVYANLLGNEAGRILYDGGALVASAGRLVAEGPRFSFRDVGLTSAVVDVDHTRMLQARTASFMPAVEATGDDVVRVAFDWPEAPTAERPAVAAWEHGPAQKEEEFTRAVSLGLFDYCRKSRSKGFVVSLSGGADSAACAVLVATMAQLGEAELGRERFEKKLGVPRDRLLTTVYQATRNSSITTQEAALAVAKASGAEHHALNVDALVQEYVSTIEGAIGHKLTWGHDDLALQNVQARTRSPSVWLMANLKNALLLVTSNRSEAAVGYCTMDGDTSGGLSPIAGIDKAFLRRWLRWMETEGPHGLGPVPALGAVTVQAPTAELRPPGAGQTDEKDLMPYEVLDAIERAAVRDHRSPLSIWRSLRGHWPAYTDADLALWVERFFRLFAQNQWKRERYAPSFHLDDENLDPRSWCRFPILSGAFAVELAELRKEAARA